MDKYKLLFIKYKKIIVPLGAILGSFLLVFLVILPQVSTVGSKWGEIGSQRADIKRLEDSVAAVNAVGEEELNADYNLALNALPAEKNPEEIFNALTAAAAATNSNVEDFAVQLGGIYGRAAQIPPGTGAPSVAVTANIQAEDARSINEFMKVLYETLPLSEMSKVSITEGSGAYTINFFYKPVDTTRVAGQYYVKPLTGNDKTLLEQLSEWKRE